MALRTTEISRTRSAVMKKLGRRRGPLLQEAWAAIRASDQAALLGDLARSVEERTPNRRVRRTSTFLMRMAAKGRRVQPPSSS